MTEQNQKTVLFVMPYFPPEGGGLERYALGIAKRLKEDHDWRVVVLTTNVSGGKDTREEVDGLLVYRLSYHLKLSNTPIAFSWLWKIRKILKAEKPDIINIHTPVPGIGNIISLLAGTVPTVVTYHTDSLKKGHFVSDIVAGLYESMFLPLLLRKAVHIINVSNFVRSGFLKKYSHKSSVITPGVDFEAFKPNVAKKTKHSTILFVASLNYADQYKGLTTLLDATKLLRKQFADLRLVVVGDGTMKGWYEEYAKGLGLESVVDFRGLLSGTDLVAAFQEAHLFALPTAKDNFPMSILEAMACGLPVVSTTVGGIPEMISEESGALVPSKDVESLTKAIGQILSDPSKLQTMGESNRSKVLENFSWSQKTEETDGLFRRILARPEMSVTQPESQRTLPEITVSVLTYNSGKTIKACLDSLTEQVNKNFCVLIVDDDSKDDTLRIVNEYIQNSSLKIEVVKNGSHIISKGRNIALHHSKTDLVAFLDSDDRADKHWTKTISQTFLIHPEVAVLSGQLVSVGNNMVGEAISTVDSTVRRFFAKGATNFCTANSAINKSILGNEPFFDETFTYSEDMEFISRIQKKYPCLFIPEMLIYQSSRGNFIAYWKQMYRYGMWRVYYGFVTGDYRPVDYIPLIILVVSTFISLIYLSWMALLALLLFSLAESIFVVLVRPRTIGISFLIFPTWIVKNYAWSLGVGAALLTLIFNNKLKSLFREKRLGY